MASRLSIAVSGGGSPPKPRNRQPNADLPQMTRSSSNCASVLCGWAASISHIGMLESTKVNLGTLARFRSPCAPGQRRGMSTAHRAEPPSTSFRSQSPAARTRVPKRSPDPLPDSHVFALGQTLDVGHFGVWQQHLKTLTHLVGVSILWLGCLACVVKSRLDGPSCAGLILTFAPASAAARGSAPPAALENARPAVAATKWRRPHRNARYRTHPRRFRG